MLLFKTHDFDRLNHDKLDLSRKASSVANLTIFHPNLGVSNAPIKRQKKFKSVLQFTFAL